MDKLNKKNRERLNNLYFESFFNWMINNPEIAKEEYPEIFEGLEKRIKDSPDHITADIIEKIPEHFVKWNSEIENCLLATREKKINKYIELIQLLLYRSEFDSDKINNAINKIQPELLEMETYFKKLLKKPKIEKKRATYQWLSNPEEELPELYRLMVNKYKLIASDTTYEQFIAIFTGQIIENIEPIKWHEDNASELLYFIYRLEQSENIKHNPNRTDYQRMKVCFVKPDGKPFNAAWKSLKTNLEINLSQDRQNAIDKLINNF